MLYLVLTRVGMSHQIPKQFANTIIFFYTKITDIDETFPLPIFICLSFFDNSSSYSLREDVSVLKECVTALEWISKITFHRHYDSGCIANIIKFMVLCVPMFEAWYEPNILYDKAFN